MGGPGAPDDMDQAHLTQAWLAASDDPQALVTGEYFYHLKRKASNPQAHDPALQDRLMAALKSRASSCRLEPARHQSAGEKNDASATFLLGSL
jgi:hypothetical protein